MHTLMFIICGVVLFGLFMAFGWLWDLNSDTTVNAFVPVWAVLSGFNMWLGIFKAGYSINEELKVLPLAAILPIIAAIILRNFF